MKKYPIHKVNFQLPVLDTEQCEKPAPMHEGSAQPDMLNAHQLFLQQQTAMYNQFMAIQQQVSQKITSLAAVGIDEFDTAYIEPIAPTRVEERITLPGPKFSREDLEAMASGEIAPYFGDWFAPLDQYKRLIRMPEPPLLLADRVTGIKGEAGSLACGTMWTETDVTESAWYLHHGRMPTGIAIESGQADLLLVSWLGFDKLNQGERIYRLLGCELTFHGPLPKPGETLCYEIDVTGYAKHGDVRLFFFKYDCKVNGELRLSVRHGQAGFFTNEELDESRGSLWSAAEDQCDSTRPLDPPKVLTQYQNFNQEQLVAFSEGRLTECFGPEFAYAQTHTRTPSIANNKMLFLQSITDFNIKGGAWGRGYARAIQNISPDDWFFNGHFKNDPCMPGTLMIEACVQLMAFYMAACGHTLERDGWRFEPVQDETFKMFCRGQAVPSSKQIVYEIFVRSIEAGPVPTLYADVLATVDGLKSFHSNMGLRLVADWPLTMQDKRITDYQASKPVAEFSGFKFDYPSLLSCAWGKPSDSFGSMYARFDSDRRVARLPGAPYHFMTRILHLDTDLGSMQIGAQVVAEYDIPQDAWYFNEGDHATMPFAVLLEAALQPCGWLSCYLGCPLTVEQDLAFRNLDGEGILHHEILPTAGTLRQHVKCSKISKMGEMIIIGFEIKSFVNDICVYELDTVFGFFPGSAFENQQGIPPNEHEKTALQDHSDFLVDLTARPPAFFDVPPALPAGRLMMLDRITGFWPQGGVKGLGRMRAEKDVQPSEWFFKAHFFQDPVQPGSLGCQALMQLLQCYMLQQNMHAGFVDPIFEPIELGQKHEWKYRGQVVPSNKLISTILDVLEIGENKKGRYVLAKASLWVDNKRIYEMNGFGMRILEGV